MSLLGSLHYLLPLINSLSFIREGGGNNAGYSKFAKSLGVPTVSSRVGMFVFYFPAMVIGLIGIYLNLPSSAPASLSSLVDVMAANRALLVSLMVFIHFAKRVVEVLFLHRYSGVIEQELLTTITVYYAATSFSAITLTSQSATLLAPVSSTSMVLAGSVLFLIGELGNLYHHYLLASLRSDGKTKEYKQPKGGLFSLVLCPHYFFELVAFLGLAIASQNLFPFLNLGGMASYLCGRAIATKAWYASKDISGVPGDRRLIFPFLF